MSRPPAFTGWMPTDRDHAHARPSSALGPWAAARRRAQPRVRAALSVTVVHSAPGDSESEPGLRRGGACATGS